MNPVLFPFIVAGALLLILLIDRIPRKWRAAIGGLITDTRRTLCGKAAH